MTSTPLLDGNQSSPSATVNDANELCPRCSTHYNSVFTSTKFRTPSHHFKTFNASPPKDSCPLCRFLTSVYRASVDDDRFNLYGVSCLRYYALESVHSTRYAMPDLQDTNMWALLPQDKFEAVKIVSEEFLKSSVQDRGAIALLDDPQTSSRSIPRPDRYRVRRLKCDEIDFGILKEWLGFCDQNHQTFCGSRNVRLPRPFVVVDCDSGELCELPEGCAYLALSYVWGNSALDPKIDTSSRGVGLPQDVPLVIHDAIKVTQELGFRYLWIDRYCISTDAAVKHSQINSMDLVYRNAYATIIAAAGDDPSFGLPGVSSRLRTPQPCISIGNKTLVSTLPHPGIAIRRSRWASRAWTFQECLLSRRRLFFTPEQVYFECQRMHCCESIDVSLAAIHIPSGAQLRHCMRRGLYPLHGLGSAPTEVWDRIEEFTQRSLTYDSDALNGMAGLLRAFRENRCPVYHIWGIPFYSDRTVHVEITNRLGKDRALDNFVKSLCWRLVRPCSRRQGFPSWSWTGWNGPVSNNYQDTLSDSQVIASGFLDLLMEFDRDTHDDWNTAYELIKSGQRAVYAPSFLNIRARTVRIALWNHPARGWRPRFPRQSSSFFATSGNAKASRRTSFGLGSEPFHLCKDPSPDPNFERRLENEDFTGIVMGSMHGPSTPQGFREQGTLILVVDKESEWESFERIGFFAIKSHDLGKLPQKTSTICLG